ncbi:MAG: tetratricopeptide repeat-containing glycosyltransferase family protein [Chthoniobacter sp.]|uniref:tetratricopeptide repeat-containing glycosyltransferase family protein n=1 Tax=Chthoniobacter sp. TaxID=2510640 RepID=UPI0032AC5F10
MPAITIEQAFQMAMALQQAGRLAEAEEACRRILAAQPDSLRATVLLGNTLADLGRWPEAVAVLERARQIDPHRPEVHFNLGNTHARAGDLGQAVASYRQALSLNPSHGKTHTNLGNVLMEQGYLDEAASHFRPALALQPDAPEMHYNLGVALSRSGQWDKAIACFRRAIDLKPDYADPHWALAPVLLRLGRHEEGWRVHARHDHCPEPAAPPREFAAPLWDGSRADGETILIHEEQGHGDAIQFLRYVPLVRERAHAARVIVECPPLLSRLVRQSGGFGAEIVDRQDTTAPASPSLPPFDRHLPFLHLPFAIEQWEPLAMAQPYLQATAESRAAWRAKLGARSHFRVGLAWAGNPQHRNDRQRSMPPEKLLPLLRLPGATFQTLQVKPPDGQPPALIDAGLIDLTADITDFADTAALITELDLVITVDTAVAHLAGALGRPVWTLLPFVPDWRWGLEREDTPWYPTMRLFRQPAPGDWESVIHRVAQELSTLMAPRA